MSGHHHHHHQQWNTSPELGGNGGGQANGQLPPAVLQQQQQQALLAQLALAALTQHQPSMGMGMGTHFQQAQQQYQQYQQPQQYPQFPQHPQQHLPPAMYQPQQQHPFPPQFQPPTHGYTPSLQSWPAGPSTAGSHAHSPPGLGFNMMPPSQHDPRQQQMHGYSAAAGGQDDGRPSAAHNDRHPHPHSRSRSRSKSPPRSRRYSQKSSSRSSNQRASRGRSRSRSYSRSRSRSRGRARRHSHRSRSRSRSRSLSRSHGRRASSPGYRKSRSRGSPSPRGRRHSLRSPSRSRSRSHPRAHARSQYSPDARHPHQRTSAKPIPALTPGHLVDYLHDVHRVHSRTPCADARRMPYDPIHESDVLAYVAKAAGDRRVDRDKEDEMARDMAELYKCVNGVSNASSSARSVEVAARGGAAAAAGNVHGVDKDGWTVGWLEKWQRERRVRV